MQLILKEQDYLGKGTNKICYYHPEDKNKCIKFSLDGSNETDMEYELKFRRMCKRRVAHSSLLTKYFGTVETNKGTGYVFECVRDFDGKLSETFESLMLREKNSPKVLEVLSTLRKKLLEESMITYTIFPDNFLVQWISEKEYRIRIIDGIGMHVLFPLPYYSKRLSRYRQKRIFNKFILLLRNKYGLDIEVEKTPERFLLAEKISDFRSVRLLRSKVGGIISHRNK